MVAVTTSVAMVTTERPAPVTMVTCYRRTVDPAKVSNEVLEVMVIK